MVLDNKLRFIEGDNMHIELGHTDQINDVACNLNSGDIVASVSSDRTCKIWSFADRQTLQTISLASAGISVRWHRADNTHLMIAEQSGAIRLYDWTRQERLWALSLHEASTGLRSGIGPRAGLKCADWRPGNAQCFGALVGSKWCLWNLRENHPEQRGEGHAESGGKFRFSPANPRYFASCGGTTLKVYNTSYPQVPQAFPSPSNVRLRDLSWHATETWLMACAGDTLYFYVVDG
ncbi:uncharacterized protein VTP21DRAFT_66 [Calcarisporiella thermophila]|uniref:uncharacterized protein n=1 Tax=Calcarisporiella thermophila TaxID=911321 RepID=UPI0037430205